MGIVFSVIWSTIVKTSPTLSDEERIRGWGTVVRELPATVFFLVVVSAGLWCAIQAASHGRKQDALRAIWVHTAALFFVLLIVMNGSTENIMTMRPSTVKWLLLPLQVCVAWSVLVVSRRFAESKASTF